MTLQELYTRRATAWEAAKNFLDTHRTEDGMLSGEDAEQYDRMEADLNKLTDEIERQRRLEAMEAEMKKPVNRPLTGRPMQGAPGEEKTGRASAAYQAAFWNAIRSRNFYDVNNLLQIGTDADGGYLVPDEYEKKLVDALQEENFFRRLAHTIQTSNGDRKIPMVLSHGTAEWMDENGLYPERDDQFDMTSLGAHKLGTAIRISEELLNDSVFNMPSYIASEFARRIGTKEEEAFLVGTGTDRPTGVFTDAELGTTTSGTSITFDDVMDLYHSLRIPYRRNASWILNDTSVKALRKIKDGNNNYIWQPSVQVGQPDMILGKPYHTSTFAPEIAAGNRVMLFGDYHYYWIADRQGRSMKRLNELYAANGQVGFLASERVDGKLILPEAVKALQIKGTASGN